MRRSRSSVRPPLGVGTCCGLRVRWVVRAMRAAAANPQVVPARADLARLTVECGLVTQLHEKVWGACRRAGLRKIRWHDLRHSFASQLASRGVPLRQVQEWLPPPPVSVHIARSPTAPSEVYRCSIGPGPKAPFPFDKFCTRSR